MTQITLNEEQSRLIDRAEGPIVLLDSRGRHVGVMVPPAQTGEEPSVLSRELTDELVARMSQEQIEWRTTEQVLERLGRLRDA